MSAAPELIDDDGVTPEEADATFIALSDPDITEHELAAIGAVFQGSRLSSGPVCEQFEAEFAAYLGRKYAVAVASGTIGMLITLQALGIGPGDEVIAPSYGYRESAQAICLAGAHPVFVDIDYWAGTIAPEKIALRVTDRTKAIIAANTNGHPAPWTPLRALADEHKLALIEDSTEAIGSKYKDRLVGTFGDVAVFDFSQPSAITCGEGGMVVTDDVDIAVALRRLRSHKISERSSLVVTGTAPFQAGISDLSAALGLAQLQRLDAILEKRRLVQTYYYHFIQSFEGIKDPYTAEDVTEVNWFLYVVHLGTRFSRSGRDAIVEDLHVEQVEAAAYSSPLHLQRRYYDIGCRRGDLFVTEKVADRAVALPFHTHLTEDQIEFIVQTMKDASVNVGAGAAIY